MANRVTSLFGNYLYAFRVYLLILQHLLYINCYIATNEELRLWYMLCKTESAIRPSKAKTVRQGHLNLALLSLLRRIIAVESFGGTIEVDSRRHYTLPIISILQ